MALLLQQAAQKIGLNLEFSRVPADGYWSQSLDEASGRLRHVNPRPSADILLTLFFKSDAAWNEARWKNPKFDQLLVAPACETDEAKRKQMYADMQTMIHDEAGIGIPLFLSLPRCPYREAEGPGSRYRSAV